VGRVARHVRRHVIGYLALFVALSGTAVALPGRNTVESNDIKSRAIEPRHLAPETRQFLGGINFGHVRVDGFGGVGAPTGLTDHPVHDTAEVAMVTPTRPIELRDFEASKVAIPPDAAGDDEWTLEVLRDDVPTGVGCTLVGVGVRTCTDPGHTARFAGERMVIRVRASGAPSGEAGLAFSWRAVPR
jgi:hypothetical protein